MAYLLKPYMMVATLRVILRGPMRAPHITRGGKQSFNIKALVYLRGIEKGWETDAEERRKGSRGVQGEEAVAKHASDSESWGFCD